MYKIFLTAFLLGLLVYSDVLAVNYVPLTSNPWYTSWGYGDLPSWANFWVSFGAGEDMREYEIDKIIGKEILNHLHKFFDEKSKIKR